MRELEIEPGFVVLLDDEDYEVFCQMEWRPYKGYACLTSSARGMSMHRIIMGFPDSFVDHIDRNPKNNQRSNLRLCNPSQNGANQNKRIDSKLPFKGIARKWNRYIARVKVFGVHHVSKSFETEREAAEEYDRMAVAHHGEFAATNKKLGLL